MSANTSYNDKVVTGEVEYPAVDPASGAFFQSDLKKNDDLKMMLDSTKDSLKLEAMKRIIGMIAKGRDASDLFPAVVKNVVSKNIEVKKLVYVYLVRYAEEQQDLALLSISTFQRALKDPNQLIRASALRVLSSIRVGMIVPIVMIAIRDSSCDMSPYVRKTAAHAIPKLYSLDNEQKDELVTIIEKLLSDKAPLVVGSAAMAFAEVCPERMSLIHNSYRKLCLLLVDVDEWGQLVLLSVLTRYAKQYFPDPCADNHSSDIDGDKPFYEDTDSDSSDSEKKTKTKKNRSSRSPTLDPDLKLLLRAAKPLLQSRNSGVVMAVAQLFYHCGTADDLPPVAKAMIRLLRSPIEVQSVVLNSIASLTINKRALYEPFLKSFFVRTSDPTHIKLLKLEIMTNLATESSAPVVLREFQTYVTSNDKTFAGATIQAIGRLAASIETVTETCLNGLLHLLSSKDEWVVCEAVVVVKRVVSGGCAGGAKAAVSRAARLLRGERLAPPARAAALWLLSEHGVQDTRAPAILAHFIPTFADQEELVKLQLLSLAVKLSITQPNTLPLARHTMTLARYDPSYDVRDRARLLRKFIEPQQDGDRGRLLKHAAYIFLTEKPAPLMESKYKDRQQFTLGTLSHYIGTKSNGYTPLPTSPATTIGAEFREPTLLPNTQITTQDTTTTEKQKHKDKAFYSEPESSRSDSTSSSMSSSSDESSDEEESGKAEKTRRTKDDDNWNRSSNTGTSDSEPSSSSSEESSSEETSNETDSREQDKNIKQKVDSQPVAKIEQLKNEKSNLELLLELDEVASSLPIMTPTCGGFLSPAVLAAPTGDDILPASPSYVEKSGQELLSRVITGGLGVTRRWTRAPHLYSPKMLSIELRFTNHTQEDINNIRINKKTLTGSRSIHDFAPISNLPPGSSATTTLGVDFADTIQPVEFTIMSSLGEVSASITPPVGELVRAVSMSDTRFDREQRALRGMTECDKKATPPASDSVACQRIFETANLFAVTATGHHLRFAGRMMSSQDLALLSVKFDEDSARVTANCSNMAISALLANEIAQAFAR